MCRFSEEELAERVIELLIASTRIEAYQKDLMQKLLGASLTDAIREGRAYEAINQGRETIQNLGKAEPDGTTFIDAIRGADARTPRHKKKKKCPNCALFHSSQKCPAKYDTCMR